MVIALLALALSIVGTGYAANRLPARSVGSRELKTNAVVRSKIKPRAVSSRAIAPNAVNGSKVNNNSLTGDDINEATLVPVSRGDSGPDATHASAAAALDAVSYRSSSITIPTGGLSTKGSVDCPVGQRIVGGGVRLDDPANTNVVDSYPAGTTTWEVNAVNVDPGSSHGATVYAICLPATKAT